MVLGGHSARGLTVPHAPAWRTAPNAMTVPRAQAQDRIHRRPPGSARLRLARWLTRARTSSEGNTIRRGPRSPSL